MIHKIIGAVKIKKTKLVKFIAFTLAEVLIVIGIIGIVAEMVIPEIISNASDSATIAMLKEDFSILQQAIKMAEPNEGRICDWYNAPLNVPSMSDTANQVLTKYLKVAKNCGANPGCFSPNPYSVLSSSFSMGVPAMYKNIDNNPANLSNIILANGSSVAIWSFGFGTNGSNVYIATLAFLIDVNGAKGPNRWGYDTFTFRVYSAPDDSTSAGNMRSQVLVPFGDITNNNVSLGAADGCYSDSTGLPGEGFGCAAWAIYKNTVSYKHGETLP